MLTLCPECKLQVSDKAMTCPHCGYPIAKEAAPKKKRKRMKLPNGFGQITEIRDRRLRRPFRAMVTIGKDEFGKPIKRTLKPQAYFKTYQEAYEALVMYHKNPIDLDNNPTMADVFKFWYEEYQKKDRAERTISYYPSLWAYCSGIYTKKIRNVKAIDIKLCIDNASLDVTYKNHTRKTIIPTELTKRKIKSMFNMIFDYAVMMDFTDKNYSRILELNLNIPEKEPIHHAFTEEELEVLWNHVSSDLVKLILIQCYSGWRPQELIDLDLEHVDLENWTFTGGMKTKAGKGRLVPIHTKIRPLVKALYTSAEERDRKYLSSCLTKTGFGVVYEKYRTKFMALMKELGMDHKPHDGRKTFVTMAKRSSVEEYVIKRLVGHAISDITEDVYTERDVKWLRREIEKI